MMNTIHSFSDLSRTLSHALRHEPWLYELELDDEGWVSLETLIIALQSSHLKWRDIRESDIVEMINSSDKKRHEISNGKIRALYGHSIMGKLLKIPATPPDRLYHGTALKNLESIRGYGLLPMNRQYVHLSTNIADAKEVGKRKDNDVVILTVLAKEAIQSGVKFYQGNENVWLVDNLPPNFIQLEILIC